jgi:TPR repeat protein
MQPVACQSITVSEAIEAFEEDHYAISYPAFERLAATRRDPEALFYLGLHLMRGFGCEIDAERALALWKRAGKMGYVDAQYALLEHVQTTSQCCKG